MFGPCGDVKDTSICTRQRSQNEFTGCTETKQNLLINNHWGFLLGGSGSVMSLPTDICYESLTTVCLVVRKRREVLIHFSKTGSPKWRLQLRSLDTNATVEISHSRCHFTWLDVSILMTLVLWCPLRADRSLSGPCVTSSFTAAGLIAPFGTKQVIESSIKSSSLQSAD